MNQIFGAFITVPLDKSATYSGTGEMFLWRMTPTPKKYAWTGHNQYFLMVCNMDVFYSPLA